MASTRDAPGAFALVHGVTWRVVSLAARVGFLALVVPRTLPGEFGLFFSYSSIGLLLARVTSFGAIDHFPTQIKGDAEKMRRACRDVSPLFLLALLVTVGAAMTQSLVGSALAVAASMTSGLMLAGAIRSVTPSWFERWMNMHPILLLPMALLVGDDLCAIDLLILQAISVLASQILLLRFAIARRSTPAKATMSKWWARVGNLVSGGFSRMLSDTLVAACLRGIAVGPVLIGAGAISDSLALALTLGEAMWTVGMILVHRNFSFYCASGPKVAHSVKSAAALLAGVSAIGMAGAVVVMSLSGFTVLQRIEPVALLASFVFFGGVTALSELRYFDLASGRPLSAWIVAQVIFVFLAVLAPALFGEHVAMWSIATVTVWASVVMIGHRWRVIRPSV